MPDPPPRALAGPPARAPAPLVGLTLAGKYTLERLLGEGAMGAVYQARQISLEKTIAIKVMHADLAADATFAARFHREAKAASRLDHPNSIRILDFGEEPGGLLYIAMEYLDGRDLLHVIEHESPLSALRIVDILAQVLSVLSMAHEIGIIHRDMKPENIMILSRKIEEGGDGDLVKVCDFGIAKVADSPDSVSDVAPRRAHARGRLTTAGLVVGTPEYMSPEQGRGEVLDARSDLYAVGVILYQLLAGRIPFDAPTPLGIVVKHQHDEPMLPSSIRPDVDALLEGMCLKALRKDPADRYASAREMRSALRSALNGIRSSPSHASIPLRAMLPLGLLDTAPAFEPATLRGSVHPGPAREGEGTPSVRPESSAPTATADGLELRTWTSRFGGRALAIAFGAVLLGTGAWYGVRNMKVAPDSLVAGVVESIPVASPVPVEPQSAQPLAAPSSALPATPAPPHLSSALSELHPKTAYASAPARPVATPPTPPRHAKESAASPSPARQEPPSVPPTPPAVVGTSAPVAPPLPALPHTPQPAPSFDVAGAHVDVGSAQIVLGGARSSTVNRVLLGVHDRMTRCYQSSASPSSPEGSWNLRIQTDDDGNISEVRLDGPLPREVKDCISSALRGRRVDADTGAVTADVQFTFKLR